MENLAALRQALMAKQASTPNPQNTPPLQGGMPVDPGMDPALSQGLPPELAGGAPPPMDLPPEVLMELERAKVKEQFKQVEMRAAEMEAQEVLRQRLAEIEEAANGLFQSGAKK